MTIEVEIFLVNQHGRSGRLMQARKAPYMIYMRVRADDGADAELMAREDFEDSVDLIARVEYDCFARLPIAQNRAVALQKANREDLVDQPLRHNLRV